MSYGSLISTTTQTPSINSPFSTIGKEYGVSASVELYVKV